MSASFEAPDLMSFQAPNFNPEDLPSNQAFLKGLVDLMQSKKKGGVNAGGALAGAGSGAIAGSAGGPIGTGIGAVVGGLAGAFS